jgi:hypothetical protein
MSFLDLFGKHMGPRTKGADHLPIGCRGWGASRERNILIVSCVYQSVVFIPPPVFFLQPAFHPSKLLLKFRANFGSSTKVVAVLAMRWFPLEHQGVGWMARSLIAAPGVSGLVADHTMT